MAKKKKKRQKTASASSKEKAVPTQNVVSSEKKIGRAKKNTGGIKRRVSVEQFRQEYAYVLKDLRTIFILAAIMFALLIAINLIAQ